MNKDIIKAIKNSNMSERDIKPYNDFQRLFSEAMEKMAIYIYKKGEVLGKAIDYELKNPSVNSINTIAKHLQRFKTEADTAERDFAERMRVSFLLLPKENDAQRNLNHTFKTVLEDMIVKGSRDQKEAFEELDKEIKSINEDIRQKLLAIGVNVCPACGKQLSAGIILCGGCGYIM